MGCNVKKVGFSGFSVSLGFLAEKSFPTFSESYSGAFRFEVVEFFRISLCQLSGLSSSSLKQL